MRLAITLQSVRPSKGGAETYVADLCRRLDAAGHEVSLFADEWEPDILPRGVRCVRVEASGRGRAARIWGFAMASEDALRSDPHDCSIGFINTWHQDILIPQGGVHAASLEANARRFPEGWRRSLYVASKRLNPKAWGLYRAIEHKQYDPARGTRYVAVSRMVARDLRRFHGVGDDRIRVIPNAIDARRLAVPDPSRARAEIRARHGLSDGAVVGIIVAHNFRLKGLPPLLEALARRRQADTSKRPIYLMVCGGGKVAPMRMWAARLRIADHVRFVGVAPSVAEYYHAADFAVLPSYYDPCSLVVFEALSCGLPVITTECNGAGEVMTGGREGFVIARPDHHEAMIEALDRMADDRGRREMAARARELGTDQTLERHVDRLLELCSDVARRRGDSPRRLGGRGGGSEGKGAEVVRTGSRPVLRT